MTEHIEVKDINWSEGWDGHSYLQTVHLERPECC